MKSKHAGYVFCSLYCACTLIFIFSIYFVWRNTSDKIERQSEYTYLLISQENTFRKNQIVSYVDDAYKKIFSKQMSTLTYLLFLNVMQAIFFVFITMIWLRRLSRNTE